ncbi:hypothetical protein IB231_03300 [Pantoea sp. PNT02]|jgi:hypothetical protein|uniref:hypothetical protein n=1 Tax=Pantoea TaxID=53335 RepID=UPI001786049C|nr:MULTISPECIES: hypothetical protein [Pantoea]MBD9642652.1 hypothetical protein [Pantoea sp. PNT02]
MAINFRQVPTALKQPELPRWWIWLLLLALFLVSGTAYQMSVNMENKAIDAEAFWEKALVIPAAIWLTLLVLRMVYYSCDIATVDKLNAKREKAIQQQVQLGQRYLNILDVSLHTALRFPDDQDGKKQWQAIQQKQQALKTQPSWQSERGIRHSRLNATADQSPEQILNQTMSATINQLSKTLASFPSDLPLHLLLENHIGMPDINFQKMWQQHFNDAHIQQAIEWLHGSGLQAIDEWLDHRSNKSSLLLVLAVNFSPIQLEGSAESLVYLLLANPGLPDSPKPLAQLHRPEQAYSVTEEDLNYAVQHAALWGDATTEQIKSGWLVGIHSSWQQRVAMALKALSLPLNIGQDLHDINSTLGYPGPAACWLTIACASSSLNEGPQIMLSGTGLETEQLWATLIVPAKDQNSNT